MTTLIPPQTLARPADLNDTLRVRGFVVLDAPASARVTGDVTLNDLRDAIEHLRKP